MRRYEIIKRTVPFKSFEFYFLLAVAAIVAFDTWRLLSSIRKAAKFRAELRDSKPTAHIDSRIKQKRAKIMEIATQATLFATMASCAIYALIKSSAR
jgi:hypothetical protein